MAFNSRESVFKYLYGASRRAPGKRARYDFTKCVYLLRRWETPGKRARYDLTKYVIYSEFIVVFSVFSDIFKIIFIIIILGTTMIIIIIIIPVAAQKGELYV